MQLRSPSMRPPIRTMAAASLGLLLSASLLAADAPKPSPNGVGLTIVAGRPAPAWEVGILDLATGRIDTARLPNLLVARERPPSGLRCVLQLDGPIDPARRAAIEATGTRLGDYLPHYAYLADLGRADLRALARTPGVRWAGRWQDAWKLDPTIGQRTFATEERASIAATGRVVVEATLFADTTRAAAEQAVLPTIAAAPIGGEVVGLFEIGEQLFVTVILPLAALGDLAAVPAVQFVEEAGEATLRNSSARWVVQTNVSNSTPFHDAGITGTGQVVGILDSRINSTHCSFSDSPPFGASHRKILAYNASVGTSSHGTHVAGTVVGDAGNTGSTRGIAYGARLVFNTIPTYSDSGIYARLQTHHNQGARVHTNSWGDDGTTAYNGLARGFDRFQRDFEDSLSLIAVTNGSSLRNPENAKNPLAVGATQKSPSQASHCSGGAGPTADGRRKPEIYAPGCNTTSASGTSCSTANLTGTSMACPKVAGTALLARQYFVDGWYPSGGPVASDAFVPTGALLKAVLLNSAVDMTGIAGYPSNLEGWGRVRLDESLHLAGQVRRLVVHDVRNAQGLATGQSRSFAVGVAGSGEKLKATLVFTDLAGTAGAANPVINDLDLVATSPSGVVYRGNVFSNGASVPGGTADIRNSVEQVHVAQPTVGTWTFTVSGTAVNQQTQGFALVVSGALSLCAAGEGAPDCDGNGVPDECEIASGALADCNGNGVPDACEIASGLLADCDRNGIPDACEIASNPSLDSNGNGLLDSCGIARGDLDNSGVIDGGDLGILLTLWGSTNPPIGDLDGNGVVDGGDLGILLANWGPLVP
jgi:hypothetical protein